MSTSTPAVESTIAVDPDGHLSFVYTDELAAFLALGPGRVRRASTVEPGPAGGWVADLSAVGGPTLGPYCFRHVAIRAEVRWLVENVIGSSGGTPPT